MCTLNASRRRMSQSLCAILTWVMGVIWMSPPASADPASAAQPSSGPESSAAVFNSMTPTDGPLNNAGIVSDDFNACELDRSRWLFVDPVGDCTVDIVGPGTGEVRAAISVPAGTNHEIWWHGNYSPRLLQQAEDSDFQIVAKFLTVPTAKYQMQGIIVQQDEANLIRAELFSDGSDLRFFCATFVNGEPTTRTNQIVPMGQPLYLRVTRNGDVWTVQHGYDGETWNSTVSFTFALTVTAVGPHAGNAGVNPPAFTAEVDYFLNTAFPIPFEDDPRHVSGEQYWVITASDGPGTVATNPKQMNYQCGQTVQLIATPAPTWGFAGWDGDLEGLENPATIQVTHDHVITARFYDTLAPPVIQHVQVSDITDSQAVVSWSTAYPASGLVRYGLTTDYEIGTIVSDDQSVEHQITLDELNPAATYYFLIEAISVGGTVTVSDSYQFTTSSGGGTGSTGVVSDDFNKYNINPQVWSFIDPHADGTVGLVDTNTSNAALLLSVPAGVSHSVWGNGNQAIRLMQPCQNVNFELEVKFFSMPSVAYQGQGILVEQDEQNFLRFDFNSTNNSLRVFAASIINGVAQTRVNRVIPAGAPLYLRVHRDGDVWQVRYSYNGVAWDTAVTFTQPLTVSSVGVFTGNSGSMPPAFTSLVDYFIIHDDPITEEDGTPAINNTPPFMYQVRATPYRTGDGATLELTWRTDEPASTMAYYRTSRNHTETSHRSEETLALTTDHRLIVRNLRAGAQYHVMLQSEDSAGNVAKYPLIVNTDVSNHPEINVWYGHYQPVGHQGTPQPWYNVLGNVANAAEIVSLSYRLNGAPARPLSMGPNGRRLLLPGDFNADIAIADLQAGENEVLLEAVDIEGRATWEFITLNYTQAQLWALPYTVQWDTVSAITDVALPVDGLWTLTDGGVRVVQPGYDRLLAIGDLQWENYEITVPVTVHAIDPSGYDPPSNGLGVGLLLRWTGHQSDNHQPHQTYIPFGAICWYSWTPIGTELYRILLNPGYPGAQDNSRTLELGVTYMFKVQVTTILNGQGQPVPRYRMKVWKLQDSEPQNWELSAVGSPQDLMSGSALLIAHHVDVTYGDISVHPVDP